MGEDGGRDGWRVWDQYVYTAVFRMGNQQSPTVQHRELCSMLHGSLDGRGGWGGMNTCINIHMAESLSCPPETITALLISYTPIQNKKKKFFFKHFVLSDSH